MATIEAVLEPWASGPSSWVEYYAYVLLDDGREGLLISFKGDHAECFYELGKEYYFDLLLADSKGVWVHHNVFKLPYTLIAKRGKPPMLTEKPAQKQSDWYVDWQKQRKKILRLAQEVAAEEI